MRLNFCPSKLHWKKYGEKSWIFGTWNHIKKVSGSYLDFLIRDITSKKVHGNEVDFRSTKLHQKTTWKWCGNSSRFWLRHIDLISKLNWRRFNVDWATFYVGSKIWELTPEIIKTSESVDIFKSTRKML